ncbi:hypothetical protein ACIO13_28335 [Streptomyces sp. NPDC087425]|uniref:hypothetical protein n=1 Tax=Streptomyces sp. NPDC087425 TaxID=3365787 RepID=UPI0037F436DC
MSITRRRVASACLLGSLVLTATGCSSDSGNGSDRDEIQGAGGEASASVSPSAAASAEKNAPSFDLPKDITVTVDRKATGDATKDAVLRDVAYAARARVEAFGKGTGQTANLNRYLAGNARVYWVNRVSEFTKDGLTVSGHYRYYGFEVTDTSSGGVAAHYCEDQSKAYNKVVKTDKVQRTQPSDKDFVLYKVLAAKDSAGDWQVTQQSWEKGDATCVQEQS